MNKNQMEKMVLLMESQMLLQHYALGDLWNDIATSKIPGIPEEGPEHESLCAQIKDAVATSQTHLDALGHILEELAE